MRPINHLFAFQLLLIVTAVVPLYGQKPEARLRMSFFQDDTTARLSARVTTRVDRRYEAVPGVVVFFSLADQRLGEMETDANGEVLFELPSSFEAAADSLNQFEFQAEIRNDPKVADETAELVVGKSRLTLVSLTPGDSVCRLQVQFLAASDSGDIPVPQVGVQFFVKRMFSMLPFGGDYNFTDDEGMVALDFPEDIRTDNTGKVTIVAQVADHEDYGTVSSRITESWGKVSQNRLHNGRALWASRSRAPWPLVLFSNTLLGLVWAIIVYLIFQLFRINKLGRNRNVSAGTKNN